MTSYDKQEQIAFKYPQQPPYIEQQYVRQLPRVRIKTRQEIEAEARRQAALEAAADHSYTGHQAGLHPENRPYLSEELTHINTERRSAATHTPVAFDEEGEYGLEEDEQLYILPCAPTVISDRLIGQEATYVKVTVSETCGAVAYDNDVLVTKATDLLAHEARQHLGTGYSLFGQARVTVTQATVTRMTSTLIFSCHGLWVYALSQEAQQHFKHLIAGKPRQEAIKLLLSLPGIEQASIVWDEHARLPKNVDTFHFVILV